MTKFNSCFIGLLFFGISALAQNIKETKVLFTIDDTPYYANDFKRIYKKNIDLVIDDNQKDVSNYLDMFVLYKLKVLKAQQYGFDKSVEFVNELAIHRNELAKNFIYDSQITDNLLQQAYSRYLQEIKASHILFELPENGSANDTLLVYNQAITIRNKVLNGEDFGMLAKQVSADPSAKQNLGDLGYFSVFKMVYPFENAAYNTPIGSVSMPVRTKFGYHLVKVTDKRANRGQVSVRHILLSENSAKPEDTKNKINEIYLSLKAGANFEQLAKNHSTDSYSAVRGGLLQPFVSGDLAVEEFENQAFALQVPGEISEPFKTDLGWHIIKLEYKKAPEKLEDIKQYLEGKILRDDRSKIIESAVIDKAKKTYTYKINQANLNALINTIDTKTYNHDWKLSDKNPLNLKPLLIIDNEKVLNVNEFVKFMTLHTNNSTNFNPISKFVNNTFTNFINTQLVSYLSDNLESTNQEFKDLIEEYHDGLLIFSILEKDIWERAKIDTIELQSFYEKNKQQYIKPKQFDADVYSTMNKKVAAKIVKKLKKGFSAAQIKSEFNKEETLVLVRSEIFDASSQALPMGINENQLINNLIKHNNYYYIVKLNEVLPERQLSLDEARQIVVSDYQQELEKTWSDRLKSEFKVQVYQSVFNEVKASLNQNQ